jgi:hypothetical protein
MKAFFSIDLFIVYLPECKQQLRIIQYMQIRDIAMLRFHCLTFNSENRDITISTF